MSENKGDEALTDKQAPPVEAPPPSYPIPQTAPAPAPIPVPLDTATAAAVGQQYRDQCELHTSGFC